MFLQQIQRGTETFVHGFVRLTWPTRTLDSESTHIWREMASRSALLWNQLLPVSASLKIRLGADGQRVSEFSFVVPEARDRFLRLVLAAFLRTDQIGDAKTEVPLEPADVREYLTPPDQQSFEIAAETLRTGAGMSLCYNLQIARFLPELLSNCTDLRIPFEYTALVAPWTVPKPLLREILLDTARLRDASYVPAALLQDQTDCAERVRRAAYDMEETVSTASQFADALSYAATTLISNAVYSEFGAPPNLVAPSAKKTEALALCIHSSALGEIQATKARAALNAASREDVDRVFAYRTFDERGGTENRDRPMGPRTPPSGSAAPVGIASKALASRTTDDRPYLFVSYARPDANIVYPIIEGLGNLGVSLWIDRSMVGGDDWIEELENRLVSSSGVLAMVSPAFVASRYCGREIRFGDALNRKIVPVFLTSVSLSGGLNFILQAIQAIRLDNQGSAADILSAIRKHIPAAVHNSL